MFWYNIVCEPGPLFSSDNVKALFRRAKAHVGAWNPEDARKDFESVMELDPSLEKAVKKELQVLDDLQRSKDDQDKEKLKGMFTKSWQMPVLL